jgi:hypothetical protein
MNVFYSMSPQSVLDKEKAEYMFEVLKKAGVNHISLYGYFWGHFESPIQDMIQAREILEKKGFKVLVGSMAVGHPGNSIDADDPNYDLNIPNHWRYRINRQGNPVYHCADIEENMIQDNIQAVKELKNAGFRLLFFDDDTRMGNWGSEIQGCFCDDCIAKFNTKFNHDITRKSLSKLIQKKKDFDILKDWVQFNCDKVTKLVISVALEGIEIGVMVMHRGDERHGIDIPELKKRISNIHLRVGEEHFSDQRFGNPIGKASELLGMLQI